MTRNETLRTLLAWAAFAAFLVAMPNVFTSRTALSLMNITGIWIVFALSYNMLLGQTGMLSFGHAVYFGLGGYAAIHAMAAIKSMKLGLPVHAIPLVGFMGGMAAGAFIGWFSCRRAGTPFAMISLGVAELISAAGLMFVSVFGGEEGISGDRTAGGALFGFSLGPQRHVTYFIAFWVFASALAIWLLTRTPLGRLANAVRDNPDRVSFIGFDPQRVRFIMFLLSSGFAGLAGALSAVNFEIITPEKLGAANSGAVLLMTYIGGIPVFYGPIIGAVLISLMQSMLSDFTKVWQLYLGLMFILVVMFAPHGIGGLVARVIGQVRRGEVWALLPSWLAGIAGALVALTGASLMIEMASRSREGGGAIAFLGQGFDPARAGSWVLAAVIALAGLGIILVVTRWRARGSFAAALSFRENSP